MAIVELTENKISAKRISLLQELINKSKKFYGEALVICVEGEVLANKELLYKFASDVITLKSLGANPIIVHGGINLLQSYCLKQKINVNYETEEILNFSLDMVEMAEMFFCGNISKNLVTAINFAGGKAVSISGKDCGFIEAKKYRSSKSSSISNVRSILDHGYVGAISSVNPEILLCFEDSDIIPIISPIAQGDNAETFYVDPYICSAVLASSMLVNNLVFYVNDAGLREKSGTLISSIQDVEFKQLYAKNNQPLIKATSVALDGRVNNIRIIDSRVEHSLALALLTEEVIGTSIFSEALDDEDDDNDLF